MQDHPLLKPQQESEEKGSSLIQLVVIFRRRWRLLATVWAAAIALVAIYTFNTTRLYRPQATLEIRPETPVVSSGDVLDPSFLASRMMWDNYYRTQESVLTSPSLLQKVLEQLPAVAAEFRGEDGTVDLEKFAENVDIEKVRSSFVLKVGYVDSEPDRALAVTNVIVGQYLDDVDRRVRDLKSDAVEVMTKETLPAVRKRVEEADRAIETFKADTEFIDIEEQYASLIESRRKVAAKLTEIRLKRAELDARLQSLQSYGSNGVTGAYNPAFHGTRILEPLVQQRAKVQEQLSKALQTYKLRNPVVMELRAQIDLVEQKIREAIRGTLTALKTDLDAAEKEAAALEKEKKRIEADMSRAGEKLARFKRLDDELKVAREVYDSYLKKHGETSATAGSGLASVLLRDPARLPRIAWKPRILFNLAAGAMAGLLLGIGIVFVVEQIDDRIGSPREVETFIGLEVLSVIPKFPGHGKATPSPILLGSDAAVSELEAFRKLRGEVVTRLEGINGAKLIAVLSSNPGEGKSTVAVNMGMVLALEGRRVLMFDADMRRPSVQKVFGMPDGPSLEDVLSGKATFEEAVRSSSVQGVDYIGAKEGSSGAAELAGTLRFEEALEKARKAYDFVLIDSAPVNLVSEAPLIARRADATLFVIREGQTGRNSAQAAVKRLKSMGVTVLGCVLNCAEPHKGGYGYGYGYGYYGYGQYGK